MSINTILWPTDLSTQSRKAAAQVASLANKYGAKVIVMYAALDLCSYFPAYGNYPGRDVLNEFRDWETEKARGIIEELCETELKSCPETMIRLVQGDPADAILDMAAKEGADLIVMSPRGLGFEKRAKATAGMGSVANAVTQNAEIPVQIV